jgi:hypothetical protein
MAAKTEHGGRKTKCPACASILTIPGGTSSRTQIAPPPMPPVARVKSGPAPVDDDFDDYEDEAPRRAVVKKRKRSALPWILGGVAALLLVASGTVAAILLLWGGGTSDMDLVPGDAQGFVVLNIADALNTEGGKKVLAEMGKNGQGPTPAEIEAKTGLKLNEIERLTIVVTDFERQIGWGLATASKPFDRAKLVAAFEGKSEKVQHAGKTLDVVTTNTGERMALYFVHDKLLAVGPEAGVKKAVELVGGKRPSGPLDDAIKRARDHHMVCLGVNPPAGRLQQLAQTLPPQAASYKALLDVQTLTLVVDGDAQTKIELSLRFPNDAKAGEAKQAIDGVVAMGKLMIGMLDAQLKQGLPPQAADEVGRQIKGALESVKVNQSGPNVLVTVSINSKAISDALTPMLGQMAGPVMPGPPIGGPPIGPGRPGRPMGPGRPGGRPIPPAGNPNPGVGFNPGGGAPGGVVGNIRGAALATQHQNNLKQIALAFHNYAATYGTFPPAVIYSKDGRTPLYSWRVAILPFIEEGQLYQDFHKDEPWDSPHNKTLLSRMPRAYALPGAPQGSTTTPYQVFVGANTPWEGDGRVGPRIPASFPDGTSNTILVAEAMHAVEWSKPADMVVEAGKSPKLLLGHRVKHDTGYAVMADGSTRSFSITRISEETLRNAINPRDGQPLGADFGN